MTRERHEEPRTEPVAPAKQATEPQNSAPLPEKIDREELLRISSALIRALDHRLRARVFRSSKHDGTRLAYGRALTAIVAAHGALLKDGQLDEIETRLKALEESKK